MAKPINWNDLKITQSELDNLLDLDFISTWAIELSRVFILHKFKSIKSLFVTEISALFLSLLLFVPLNLIFFRHWEVLENNTNGFVLVLAIAISFSILVLVVLNFYLWHRAKGFKSLALILEKINDYNDLIERLKFITEINNFNYLKSNQNRLLNTEIKPALRLTKNSLINSVELEKFIQKNQQIRSDRYQIFANLEENLIQFLSLADQNTNSEDRQLLTEVIQIGLSVHQELRKIQTLRQSQI